MTPELADGGGYLIIVDESNLSVYVRLITNDVIRIDDESQYYGYQSTFLNGQKVSNLVSVGTVGGGGGGDEENSVGDGPVTLNSTPQPTTEDVTPATTYAFALDGRRISKAGAVDLKYLYDGENVVYELWDNMTVRFTHPIPQSGGCGCGAGNCAIFFTDHPISISIDGVKYYYLYDGLGSVSELIDESENVVNFYRYTPFGDALVRGESVYNPHQFTGRQYDAESGLYHYRARAYAPDIGRFMQQDPAGMVDGANMYAYVGNNPVNGVDPSGQASFWCNYWAMTKGQSWKSKYPETHNTLDGWPLHFAIGVHIARKGCSRSNVYAAGWHIEEVLSWVGKAQSSKDVNAVMWGWYYHMKGGYYMKYGTRIYNKWPIALAKEMVTSKGSGVGYNIEIGMWPPSTHWTPSGGGGSAGARYY